MLHILPPTNRRLVWYLAMEEYLAQNVQEDMFVTWVVSPTVIFGRHQVMEAEVNMAYCQANGIAMYRRKSGGGCVYADEGNLMMSLVSPNKHSEQVFQSFLDSVSGVLRDLGFAAVKSEHNDIMVEGYKVSGNACYALPTGTIVHGTLLVNVDFDALQHAITPSVEKLAKHGVKSVRQRVANLAQYAAFDSIKTIEGVNVHLINTLCARTRTLTREEIAAIDEIEKDYLNPQFIAGK
ncbi:MAG: lipoate--protein ligase family protein [Paludibacteraceae bacterium]|nr:lipoate--protein ligase family protein [Paludibacteraceae bacterium]